MFKDWVVAAFFSFALLVMSLFALYKVDMFDKVITGKELYKYHSCKKNLDNPLIKMCFYKNYEKDKTIICLFTKYNKGDCYIQERQEEE